MVQMCVCTNTCYLRYDINDIFFFLQLKMYYLFDSLCTKSSIDLVNVSSLLFVCVW